MQTHPIVQTIDTKSLGQNAEVNQVLQINSETRFMINFVHLVSSFQLSFFSCSNEARNRQLFLVASEASPLYGS